MSDDRDVAELRRLVGDAGGENKIYLKMEPPSLDECEDYTVWRKLLEVWKVRTSMNAKQQAASPVGLDGGGGSYLSRGSLLSPSLTRHATATCGQISLT